MIPILFVITLGIYGLVWFYSTSAEVIRYNRQNDDPVLWLIFAVLPVLNIVAIWYHSQAIGRMRPRREGEGNSINGGLLFVLWLVPIPFLVGMILSQLELNKRATAT